MWALFKGRRKVLICIRLCSVIQILIIVLRLHPYSRSSASGSKPLIVYVCISEQVAWLATSIP